MRKILLAILILLYVVGLNAQVEPNWESINKRAYPQWFSDAKLGIFIHWGLYSVPSYSAPEQYGEWFYRGLMIGDSARINFMKRTYGENFKYEDFDLLFKAELFNADEWTHLFKEAGAKYVLLVTKHHDGYCLWDCPYKPHFNSVVGGPKRDIVDELTTSVRKSGMKMGFYYSLAEWTNPLHRWYVDHPDSIGRYVDEYMIPQFKNLVAKYKPSLIFTDGEWSNTIEQWHAAELIAWYYNTVGLEAIVNDRWGVGGNYGFKTPEYSSAVMDTTRPWAECRGLGRSFGLNRNEPLSNYVTSEELIQHFVKLVAAGGGMTLNVGPGPDGQIPLLQQERLLDLGKWLEINGEAIYSSKPYYKFGDFGPKIFVREDAAIDFDWVRNAPDKSLSYDNFEVIWSAKLNPPVTGVYTFEAEADDFMTLKIDGKIVFSNKDSLILNSNSNAQEANTSKSLKGTIELKKDKTYFIEVLFEEKSHQATAKLFWSYPGQEKTLVQGNSIIPSAQYSIANYKTPGFLGLYYCLQPKVVYTTKPGKLYAIALEYPDDQLILNITQPEKGAKVILLGSSETPLKWKYKNGKLIIDTSTIKYSEIKSKGAWVFSIDQK